MVFRKTVLTVLALLAVASVALAGGAVKLYLARPVGDPDGDAQGFVKAKAARGSELLEVAVRNVPGGATYGVFMDDGTGVLAQVGDIQVASGKDGGKWKLNTKRGDGLPFSAASVLDLALRPVEVRDTGGEVVLEGKVPDASAKTKGGARKSKLAPPAAGADPDAKGFVKAKGGRGAELLQVVAQRLGSATYDVFIDDGTGVMTDVGDLVVAAGESSGKWMVNRRRGDPLPFGACSTAELAGRSVEIRDQTGAVTLAGEVPGPKQKPGNNGRGRGGN